MKLDWLVRGCELHVKYNECDTLMQCTVNSSMHDVTMTLFVHESLNMFVLSFPAAPCSNDCDYI